MKKCDDDCDEFGRFPTINEDGQFGPLYPRSLPCPNYPACRGEHAPREGGEPDAPP